jgi:hypothetical protein
MRLRFYLLLALFSIVAVLPKVAMAVGVDAPVELDRSETIAQYFPPAPPPVDMCGYQESSCYRDEYGNIVDKETGDVYDRNGNFIQSGNGGSSYEEPACKYVETKECGLFNFNCIPEWEWICNE